MFYKIIFFRRIRERNKRKPEVVWKNVARAARAVGKSDFTKLPRIFQFSCWVFLKLDGNTG